MVHALLVLLVLVSGCGLTTYSRDYLSKAALETAEEKCRAIYCSGFGEEGQPSMWECPNLHDLVVLCVEEGVERHEKEARENVSWFGRFSLGVVDLFTFP